MIICVPTGALGLKSESPNCIVIATQFVAKRIAMPIQFVSAVMANEYARGPPLENTLSHKERTARSLLLVA